MGTAVNENDDVQLDHTVRLMPDEQLRRLEFHCPGCLGWHYIPIEGPNAWGFNGDFVRPTLTPSILVRGGTRTQVCHSFMRDGEMEFLSDCTHANRDKKLPLLPRRNWPKWSFE
jgi:hypothetical protein